MVIFSTAELIPTLPRALAMPALGSRTDFAVQEEPDKTRRQHQGKKK